MLKPVLSLGYNPLRWDCERQGYFNKLMRPKIEVFSDCFPGKINFGDVDGIVEINGNGLLLEWKRKLSSIPLGQELMYERLTTTGILTVFCVFGNPETMEVWNYFVYKNGQRGPTKNGNLMSLKADIYAWAQEAKRKYNGR